MARGLPPVRSGPGPSFHAPDRVMTPSPSSDPLVLFVLAGVWISAILGSGFLLALIAKRIHPSLSLGRLWVFYSILMGVLATLVTLLGIL